MTQDKKELLELAARASGIVGNWERDKAFVQERYYFNVPYAAHGMLSGFRWDPLTDDGDCARLEEKLKIDLAWREGPEGYIRTTTGGVFIFEYYADHNNDRQAARRLASTRAAAEVGRGMK
jgi:hypothetical protein